MVEIGDLWISLANLCSHKTTTCTEGRTNKVLLARCSSSNSSSSQLNCSSGQTNQTTWAINVSSSNLWKNAAAIRARITSGKNKSEWLLSRWICLRMSTSAARIGAHFWSHLSLKDFRLIAPRSISGLGSASAKMKKKVRQAKVKLNLFSKRWVKRLLQIKLQTNVVTWYCDDD